jgi:hypothetical protein
MTATSAGLRPEPHQVAHWSALRGPILDPQQRAEPFAIYQLGLFSGEGQPCPINVRVGPPLRTNPLTGSKGRCPWRGPGAAPLVGIRGEAPRLAQ